jgi:hypothetical protein
MQIKARRALSQPNERCRPQDRLPEPVTGPPQGRPLPARHQSSPSCHQLERCARNRRRCRHRCRGAEQWFTFRLNGQTDDDVFLDVRSISGRPKLAKRGSWFRIVKFCSSSFANQFRDRGSPACPERRAARLLRLRWSDTASISEKTSLLGHLCWVSSSVWSRVRRAYASTQARRRCVLRHRQWPATRENEKRGRLVKRKEGRSSRKRKEVRLEKTKAGVCSKTKAGVWLALLTYDVVYFKSAEGICLCRWMERARSFLTRRNAFGFSRLRRPSEVAGQICSPIRQIRHPLRPILSN